MALSPHFGIKIGYHEFCIYLAGKVSNIDGLEEESDRVQFSHFCRPLLLLPSISPSIRVSSNDSVPCIRWPKYWSFRFSISPSNAYSGLISFRMDWLDLFAVQEL